MKRVIILLIILILPLGIFCQNFKWCFECSNLMSSGVDFNINKQTGNIKLSSIVGVYTVGKTSSSDGKIHLLSGYLQVCIIPLVRIGGIFGDTICADDPQRIAIAQTFISDPNGFTWSVNGNAQSDKDSTIAINDTTISPNGISLEIIATASKGDFKSDTAKNIIWISPPIQPIFSSGTNTSGNNWEVFYCKGDVNSLTITDRINPQNTIISNTVNLPDKTVVKGNTIEFPDIAGDKQFQITLQNPFKCEKTLNVNLKQRIPKANLRIDSYINEKAIDPANEAIVKNFSIPIFLILPNEDYAICKPDSVYLEIEFRKTLFLPSDISSIISENDTMRTVKLTSAVTQTTDNSILVNLNGSVLLGDVESTPLTIKKFNWNRGNRIQDIETSISNGILQIKPCGAGGDKPRLVVRKKLTFLSAYPNPTSDKLTLEFLSENKESINIEINDIMGNRIFSYFDLEVEPGKNKILLNLSENINSGQYYIRILDTYITIPVTIIR